MIQAERRNLKNLKMKSHWMMKSLKRNLRMTLRTMKMRLLSLRTRKSLKRKQRSWEMRS